MEYQRHSIYPSTGSQLDYEVKDFTMRKNARKQTYLYTHVINEKHSLCK